MPSFLSLWYWNPESASWYLCWALGPCGRSGLRAQVKSKSKHTETRRKGLRLTHPGRLGSWRLSTTSVAQRGEMTGPRCRLGEIPWNQPQRTAHLVNNQRTHLVLDSEQMSDETELRWLFSALAPQVVLALNFDSEIHSPDIRLAHSWLTRKYHRRPLRFGLFMCQ